MQVKPEGYAEDPGERRKLLEKTQPSPLILHNQNQPAIVCFNKYFYLVLCYK